MRRPPQSSITAFLSLAAFAMLLLAPGAASTQTIPTAIVWRDISPGKWQWLEDYVFASATYRVGCPRDRKCRVGAGMFFGGQPRGSERDFSGDTEVRVIGFGALHVKVLDGTTPARVGFYRQSQVLIPIYPAPGL